MKKFLFFMAMTLPILLFSSCSKEEEDMPNVSTFTIINNNEKYDSTIEYLDGSMYEVVVFEYDETGNNIGQINIDDITYGGGKSDAIPVQDECSKVQVSFKMLPKESPYYDLSSNKRLYVASLSVIKKGSNTNIIIDSNTMTSSNPSTKTYSDLSTIKLKDVLSSFLNNL